MSKIKGGQKEKIGPRKWRIRISLGKDPVTGKYMRSPSRIVVGNSKDADAALAEYRIELQAEIDNPGLKLSFAEYAKDFYKNREILGESPLSRKSEKMEIVKLIDMFGSVTLEEITPSIIKKAYLDATSKTGMSQAMLKRISKRLKMILAEAVDDEILARNPAAKIKVAEPKRKSPKPLSEEEAGRLTAIIENNGVTPLTAAIRLMLFGGLRKGEVLGLDWENVHFDSNSIYVCKQFSNDRMLRPPKSANSRRWVNLDPKTMNFLEKWKREQPRTIDPRLKFEQEPATPVIANQFGTNMDPTNFNREFRDFCVKYGFGTYESETNYVDDRGYVRTRKVGYRGLTPHALRHTHATLLIGANNDVKTVSSRLGHSSVSLTLNIYADAIRKNDVSAAESLAKMLEATENKDIGEGGMQCPSSNS